MQGLWYCVLPHLLEHCDGHSGHFAPQQYKSCIIIIWLFDKKRIKRKGKKNCFCFYPFLFLGGFRWRLSLDHGQIVLTVVIRAFIQGHNGATIRWKFLEVTTSVIGGRFRGWQKMQEIMRTTAHVSFWKYHFAPHGRKRKEKIRKLG